MCVKIQYIEVEKYWEDEVVIFDLDKFEWMEGEKRNYISLLPRKEYIEL